MLENKIFEIRDRATFIPVLCTKMAPGRVGETTISGATQETKLLRATGYGFDFPLILMSALVRPDSATNYDPFKWGDRTMHTAHVYIAEHYDELETGAVVDVEYILGETKAPKESDCR